MAALPESLPAEWAWVFDPFQSLSQWYRAEEQEFFRRELRRTGRWLFRGTGATWIAAYAAVLIVQSLLVVNIKPGVTGYGSLSGAIITSIQYSWVFVLPSTLAILAWVEAIRTRTFSPLAGERGRELVLTELRPEQFWPALLFAPIAMQLAMMTTRTVAGFMTFTHWLFTEGPPDPSDSVAVWLLYKVYGALIILILGAVQSAAATGWAVRLIHPGGGWMRIALGGVAVSIFFNILNAAMIFISQAIVFQRLDQFLALNLRDPGLLVPYHLAFLPGVAFRIALFGVLFWLAVKGLRSRRATEAWRASLEP